MKTNKTLLNPRLLSICVAGLLPVLAGTRSASAAPTAAAPQVETAEVEEAGVDTAGVETAEVENAEVETASVETASVETASVEEGEIEDTRVLAPTPATDIQQERDAVLRSAKKKRRAGRILLGLSPVAGAVGAFVGLLIGGAIGYGSYNTAGGAAIGGTVGGVLGMTPMIVSGSVLVVRAKRSQRTLVPTAMVSRAGTVRFGLNARF